MFIATFLCEAILDMKKKIKEQIKNLSYTTATTNQEEMTVYWTAVFEKTIGSGSLNATGKNGAGGIKSTNLFTVKRDTQAPVISEVKPSATDVNYNIVYKAEKEYFINNTKGKFDFAITADDNAKTGEQASGLHPGLGFSAGKSSAP